MSEKCPGSLNHTFKLITDETTACDVPARSLATQARAAVTQLASLSAAQAVRPSLAATPAVVPRPTNGSPTRSPGKLNGVMHRSGNSSGKGAGLPGSWVP